MFPFIYLLLLTGILPCGHGFISLLCELFPNPFCQGQGPNPNPPRRRLPPPKIKVLGNDFITPQGNESDFAFHFNPKNLMDWMEALTYCKGLNSTPLQILNVEDENFVGRYLESKGYRNAWWLGLRRTSGCQCRDSKTQKTVLPIDLAFEKYTPIQIKCRHGSWRFCKNFYPWIWYGSKAYPTKVIPWHSSTDTDNCATLRKQKKILLTTQNCRSLMAPICMKRIVALKPENIPDNTPLEDATHCFDNNVIYRGTLLRKSLKFVPNARRCSAICRTVKGCRYWIWRGDLISRLCVLKQILRNKNFRYQKSGAVAGKVLSCRSSLAANDGPCYMSYNTELIKSEVIEEIIGSESSQNCLKKCRALRPLCRSFSWLKGSKTTKCILSASSAEDGGRVFSFRQGGVSGVYGREECFWQTDNKSKCICKSFDYDYYDQETGGATDVDGAAKGCTPMREFAFCPILNETETSSQSFTPLSQKEVCIEIGVGYGGDNVISKRAGIKSAVLCRELCTKSCRHWTWSQLTKECSLRNNKNIIRERLALSVSGSVIGLCSNERSILSLNRCACLPLDAKDEKRRKKSGERVFADILTIDSGDETCQWELILKCGPNNSVQKFVPDQINFS